jgi:hypothetical protein
LGLLRLAQRSICNSERRLQAGMGWRRSKPGGAKLVDHLLRLTQHQHGASQVREDSVVSVLGCDCLAKLDFRGQCISFLQQGRTQQVARFGLIRVLLQRVLDLNDR